MKTAFVLAIVGTAAASALLTVVCAHIAPRLGLADDGRDAPERKLQRRAVPLVGGVVLYALFLAWAVLVFANTAPSTYGVCAFAAVTAGFALGLVDDRAPRGLAPGAKFQAQLAVAGLCAVHAYLQASSRLASADAQAPLVAAALAFCLALAAINAFNTFDNADGAASLLGVIGFASLAQPCAAAFAGFLPFNLWLRRSGPDGTSTPRAYLGDSGAHVAGVFVALEPALWPVLVLPLLDLARLSRLRLARGSRPWIGDRRHLAHRLQARGLGPTAVAGVLAGIAVPALAAAELTSAGPWVLPAGVAATVALFVGAVCATPDVG